MPNILAYAVLNIRQRILRRITSEDILLRGMHFVGHPVSSNPVLNTKMDDVIINMIPKHEKKIIYNSILICYFDVFLTHIYKRTF